MSSPKEVAGRRAAEFVEDGTVVGLGTGSTAEFAIRAIGDRVAGGLSIKAIPTSEASAALGPGTSFFRLAGLCTLASLSPLW